MASLVLKTLILTNADGLGIYLYISLEYLGMIESNRATKNMLRKSICLIISSTILILAFFSAACGPSSNTTMKTINFRVQVIDAANNPLSGAKVVSENQPSGQIKINGLTYAEGLVTFAKIKPGEYTLYVTRFDYNQVQIAITITPSNDHLMVKMSPSVSPTITPTSVPINVTFSQLIDRPQSFTGQFVTLEGFYFSGFEISALAMELVPSTLYRGNLTPQQPLIWVTGSLGQNVYDNLYKQSVTSSGYPESFGKIRVTGQFQYGGKYGHLDSYAYQLTVTSADLLPWSPSVE
jgi:hypothetical protein